MATNNVNLPTGWLSTLNGTKLYAYSHVQVIRYNEEKTLAEKLNELDTKSSSKVTKEEIVDVLGFMPISPDDIGDSVDTNYLNDILKDYAHLANPDFTGTPTAPTPNNGDNSTRIATTEFINNLEIGGRNLVKNGEFNQSGSWSTVYWDNWGETASVSGPAGTTDAIKWYNLINKNSVGSSGSGIQQDIRRGLIEANTTYTISARVTGDVGSKFTIGLEIYTIAGTSISLVKDFWKDFTITKDTKKVKFVFTTPNNSTMSNAVLKIGTRNTTSTNSLQFKDIKMEKGTIATLSSPAFEEYLNLKNIRGDSANIEIEQSGETVKVSHKKNRLEKMTTGGKTLTPGGGVQLIGDVTADDYGHILTKYQTGFVLPDLATSSKDGFLSKEDKSRLDKLEIGGRNLLPYTTSFYSWKLNYLTIKTNLADPFGGTNAISLQIPGNIVSNDSYALINDVPNVDGYYTVSFWGKANKACTLKVHEGNNKAFGTASLTTSWKKYSYTLYVDDTSSRKRFYFGGASSWTDSSIVIYLAYIKLEKGTEPTDWTPCLSDFSANYLKVVNSTEINASSSLTANDLAKHEFAIGMIKGNTDNPCGTDKWFHALNFGWKDGLTSWTSQLALGVHDGTGLYYRTSQAGNNIEGRSWNRVLDSSNYADYVSSLISGTSMSNGFNGTAKALARSGTLSSPMTFNWSGKDGQPTWLWGGEDGTSMYVYNPKNFNVNSASKLTTSRKVTLSGLSNASFNFDGSANVGVENWGYGTKKYVTTDSTAKPYFRIAYTSANANYVDASVVFMIDSGYKGGGFGIVKVAMRTNNIATANQSECEVSWLVRQGFDREQLFASIYSPANALQYADLYFHATKTYSSINVTVLSIGGRGTKTRSWTFEEGDSLASASIRNYSFTTLAMDVGIVNSSANSTKTNGHTVNKDVPSDANFSNTWRGIQDNLTSDSATDSLSAKQGKALKALIDNKQGSGHYATSAVGNSGTIVEFYNSRKGTTGGIGSVSLTKLSSGTGSEIPAGWYNYLYLPHRHGLNEGDNNAYATILLYPMNFSGNSYIVRFSSSAIADVKAFSIAGHTHSYLPLSGGTVTGTISSSKTTNTYLAGNQGQALINSTANAGTYVMLAKLNSTNGYFTHGVYGKTYLLQYTAKSTVTAGNNSVTRSVTLLDEDGHSSFSFSNHTHNYAGSSTAGGSATSAEKLNTSAGGSTTPVYFSNGKPVACSYTLGKSVPSNAVFTDTNTTYSNFVKSGTGAKAGLVPAPSTTAGTTKYLREDGTWSVPPNTQRGIVDNLTSTSTTTSLSANQGRLLANGSGRDSTKLLKTGDQIISSNPYFDICFNNNVGENVLWCFYRDGTGYVKMVQRWRVNGHYGHLCPLNISADRTWNLPNATGTIALTTSSSRRIKKNIVDVKQEEINKIFQLKVKSFDYINEDNGTNQCGLIAEDVYKILPEVVLGNINCKDSDFQSIKQISIDYPKLVPYLIKIIQNHESKITELENKIDNITNILKKNNLLKNRKETNIMQTIVLKDGTKLQNVIDGERGFIEMRCTSSEMIEIIKSLTDENLSKYTLYNDTETEIFGVYVNRKFTNCSYDATQKIAKFNLIEINETELRLKSLEDTVDALILSSIE